mmetsp:Transcript_45409/g.102843  ORF Transcript_45409/g.102843 Transcript_45409/m.102843 type:complete len:230 (-) Transcript_45409:1242-1931(-)
MRTKDLVQPFAVLRKHPVHQVHAYVGAIVQGLVGRLHDEDLFPSHHPDDVTLVDPLRPCSGDCSFVIHLGGCLVHPHLGRGVLHHGHHESGLVDVEGVLLFYRALQHVGLEVEKLEDDHGIGNLLRICSWGCGLVVTVVRGEQRRHIYVASVNLFLRRCHEHLGHLPTLRTTLALEQLGRVKVSTDFFVRYELEHAMSALLVESSVKVISEDVLRFLLHDPVTELGCVI